MNRYEITLVRGHNVLNTVVYAHCNKDMEYIIHENYGDFRIASVKVFKDKEEQYIPF